MSKHTPEYTQSQLESLEIWLPVPSFEECYEISDRGRVRGLARLEPHWRGGNRHRQARLLKLTLSRFGYMRIRLFKEGKSRQWHIHTLVALAFVGPQPDPKYQVNHKNGIKTDNRPDNLEWMTARDNHIHARQTGLWKHSNRGSAHGNSRLTESAVLEIRQLLRQGYRPTDLARRFGVSKPTISGIKNGSQWKHVSID